MKKIKLLVLVSIVSISAGAQKMQINGQIDKRFDGAMVHITYPMAGNYIQDSAAIKNGKFYFSHDMPEPVKGWIEIKAQNNDKNTGVTRKRDMKEVMFEPGSMKVVINDGSVKNAIVKGGPAQQDLNGLQQQLQPWLQQADALMDSIMKYYKKDEAMVNKFDEQAAPVYDTIGTIKDEFVKAHPGSYVSIYLLRESAAIIDPEKFEPKFNALSEKIRNSAEGKKLAERLEIAKRTAIGQMAMPFELNDTMGNPVSLSTLKGKYVLIDFWASWCGPCRAENPNLVSAYKKFAGKNFEILGVSLDSNKDAWIKAIKQDNLTWLHVSDLQGWKNEVAAQYGIRAVPQNFLLDPGGKIIASNIRGEELEKKLSGILGGH